MLEQVYAAVHEGKCAEALALLEADLTLLASDDGQHTLGYLLAHEGRFDEAREVYARLRDGHAGEPGEHIFIHQLGMVERLAGNYAAALHLFTHERTLIENLPEAERPFKRAVNGYEVGVNLLSLGQVEAARRALADAFADAQTSGDPMTLGCVRRALGDLATDEGRLDAARQEYDRAHADFLEAGDERAAAEVQARGKALEQKPGERTRAP